MAYKPIYTEEEFAVRTKQKIGMEPALLLRLMELSKTDFDYSMQYQHIYDAVMGYAEDLKERRGHAMPKHIQILTANVILEITECAVRDPEVVIRAGEKVFPAGVKLLRSFLEACGGLPGEEDT